MMGLAQLKIRLPRHLKAFIEAEAEANASSQNSEIVRCIRERMKAATGGTFGDITPAAAQEKAALAGAANVNQGNGAAQDDYRRE